MLSPRPARRGANGITAPWLPAENDALARLYPTAYRSQVEAALPTRSWNAMGLQAGVLGIKRRFYWIDERIAILTEHYPAHGAAYVAGLLGCPMAKVTKQASVRGISRQYVPKPAPTPKRPRAVKSVPKPKPAPVADIVPQKECPATPNLNAQMARKRKRKKAAGTERLVSLAYIKSLPFQHPEAHQYRMGGERAVLKYREQLQRQAA